MGHAHRMFHLIQRNIVRFSVGALANLTLSLQEGESKDVKSPPPLKLGNASLRMDSARQLFRFMTGFVGRAIIPIELERWGY